MRHRAFDYDSQTAVTELGSAALDDLLDRGDLDDWRPLLREVAADPLGEVASRVLLLLERRPPSPTSALWRAWIEFRRDGAEHASIGGALRAIREERGLTQVELGKRLEMSQSEVSKLERRGDVLVSTLRAYVSGLGATLQLVATFSDGDRHIS